MVLLTELGDDVLRRVLHPRLTLSTRSVLSRVCRRLRDLVRAETTLLVELTCTPWITTLPSGIGRAGPRDDELVAPVSVGIDLTTVPSCAPVLADALELVLSAHRRTASAVSVRYLRLHRHRELRRLLPALSFQVAAAASVPPHRNIVAERLREITLMHCSLPIHLGRLLTHVHSLRIWDCAIESNSEEAWAELVGSLAAMPLETLVWAGERQPIPAQLLETRRETSLSRLVLAMDCIELDSLVGVEAGGSLDWWGMCGECVTTLGVLSESELLPSVATCLVLALPRWSHLVHLHISTDALTSLANCRSILPLAAPPDQPSPLVGSEPGFPLHDPPPPIAALNTAPGPASWGDATLLGDAAPPAHDGSGAIALIESLPPTLESLGSIDCSWLAPTWFFDALDQARARYYQRHSACLLPRLKARRLT